MITTYTEANEEEIRRKLFQRNKGCIPENITIQTWFSFLLKHGVRPYQSVMNAGLDEKRIGFHLTERQSGCRAFKVRGKPVYWGEENIYEYYFTKDLRIYSDKISKYVIECNRKTEGEVIGRISRVYPVILIDEVQDLAGWELEILKCIFETPSEVVMVGDPRQVTYLTHHPQKYKKYKDGKIGEFVIEECKKGVCEIDDSTLKRSHRNNEQICRVSSKLFPQYPRSEPCECERCRGCGKENEGVFLVKEKDVEEYKQKYSPTILREKNARHPEWNFGRSKGLDFERVLIYPTEPIKKWLRDPASELAPTSRCKFYVAITRARHSVGIVYDYEEGEQIEGVCRYNDTC